eukprot:UN01395
MSVMFEPQELFEALLTSDQARYIKRKLFSFSSFGYIRFMILQRII